MCIRVFKGNIVFTPSMGCFKIIENGYIVVENNVVIGVYEELPDKYAGARIFDYGDRLIVPGFVDLHLHAPQFANRGLGLDGELLDWLERYTFYEESKYADIDYAREAYTLFVRSLWKSGTTRSVVFATIYNDSTELLMELLSKAGLSSYVGRLNMDINSADYYIEDTKKSIIGTEEFVLMNSNKYELVKPIITPRFAVSCSGQLLRELGHISTKYGIPVQSHLSENKSEIEFVKKIHASSDSYVDLYRDSGLMENNKVIMAHCVWSDEHEMDVLRDTNTLVAHCPISNANISSGIAPVRKFLDRGISVGLGSDISGGHSIFMPHVISLASQLSKMRCLYIDKDDRPLTTAELFYMATKGGGAFFGKVGSFEDGFEFDALVIDDSNLEDITGRSIEERIQRFLYLGDDRNIVDIFVSGQRALGI